MKLTVFGAAGGTGKHVVEESLAAGHEVTVLVRDPLKLGAVDPRVTVEIGDARDPEVVARAVAGAQGVLSAIGGRGMGRSTAITDAMTTIVAGTPTGTRLLAVEHGRGGRLGVAVPAGRAHDGGRPAPECDRRSQRPGARDHGQ